MGCATCAKDTAMIRIGTGDYCGTCGTRAGLEALPKTAARTASAPLRRSMDIGPAQHGSSHISPQFKRSVVVTAPKRTAAQSAAALHARSTGRLADLRQAPAPKPPASPKLPKVRVPAIAPTQATAPKPKLEPYPTAKTTHAPDPKIDAKFRSERFDDRLDRAKQIGRSPSVAKFSQHFQSNVAKARQYDVPEHDVARQASVLSAAAATHHEALSRLINQMPPVNIPSASSRGGRVAAVLAAIVVMSGYVWFQNYPKMAIQSAGSKAGLNASMPAYVPSSYSLKKTTTQPGLVTLQFASPNQPQRLTINQHRTEWDSDSLLDNFVAKQGTDYTAVNGQGLTIYLFGQNQAAWINHGVWYSITGATRLNREQILKMAYSL